MAKVTVSGDSEVLLPEGNHFAIIEAVEDYVGSTGKKSLHWVFAVRAEGFPEYKVECWTSLGPGAQKQYKLRLFLKALGLPHTGELAFDTDEIVGKACQIKVSHEMFRDEMKVQVDEIVGLATMEDVEKAYSDPFANC